ncbi:MAG: insulinase family protein [Pseudomonadota bacterium]
MAAVTSNQIHPAFRCLRRVAIESLNLVVEEFVHERTGALHYHLASDHEENVFMVAFRTVPMDSTGVAHILEHTVLCGSERYPVRDPFFWMIRRSLNTFMNAFTTNDYTAYPFASQNRKDFNNLLDVYLDAVFFARLDPLDFAQEGHRIEFETPSDPSTPLVYRGVVYNEMKGDSSSPISVLYEALQKALYPTTTYHYNSGGDPLHIPELGYDDLLHFYRSHYHPGNAVFMTFGNIGAAELQQRFEDRALCRFDDTSPRIQVGREQRYPEPRRVRSVYGQERGESTEGKTHIVIAWLLGENTDLEMLLKCNLLSDALLDTAGSPLRLALETTPLAGALSPISGLEETAFEMSFVCGVEGSEAAHTEAIEALVLATLQEVARTGLPLEKLEACLHQLELSQREIGGDGSPFGLQLIFSCVSAAVHPGDPISLLDLDPVLARLREQIREPGFFERLVSELLLDNPHRVTLTLEPDPAFAEQLDAAERNRLNAERARMTQADVDRVVARAAALAARQEAPDNIDVLPRVSISDVPLDVSAPVGTRLPVGNGLALNIYEAGTNGLCYHQIISRMPTLDASQLTYLPFFTTLVTEVGSGSCDYIETQHQQHSLTGGISAYAAFRGTLEDPDHLTGYLTFSSKTLADKSEAMLDLMKRTFEQPVFNERRRIRDLVKQMRLRRESSITGNGHTLAMTAAAAGLRPVAALNHELSGLASLSRLKHLDDSLTDDAVLDGFIQGVTTLHNVIMTAERQLLLVTDSNHIEVATQIIESLWQASTQGEAKALFDLALPTQPPQHTAWLTSTQVNFCASAYSTLAENHADSAALSVLAGVLRNGFLHTRLREQGGAYGGGATHDASNGVFRFYSYRDPNLMRTFEVFEESIDWVKRNLRNFDLVEESILGIISGLDAPASPAGEARQTFHQALFGRTPDQRRAVRAAVLGVTVEDVLRVTERYLGGEPVMAAVTSEKAARSLPGQFVTATV